MRGGFLMHTDLDEQYDKIYRYCYMKLRHQQAAEDITQKTFLRFLENKTYKEKPVCRQNHSGSDTFSWRDHMSCAGLCSSCFDPLWVSWTEYIDTDDISHVFISPYNWAGIGYPAFYTSNSSSSGISICHVLC